jgi:hypothetical protein
MIYLMYCENFCKCYNVPPPSTTIKIKVKKKLYEPETNNKGNVSNICPVEYYSDIKRKGSYCL